MHLFVDILRNSILITGLVIVMMMMIESLNIESRGLLFKGLRKTGIGQVIIGALLGSIPGCMGGFATVSLYTHRMLSFGALTAMLIASSGDESFIMLAMIPEQAMILFAILFIIAIAAGLIVDKIFARKHSRNCLKEEHDDCGPQTNCIDGYEVHEPQHKKRTFGWKRAIMSAGLAIFIAALATGQLGHDHNSDVGHIHTEDCQHHHEHSANVLHSDEDTAFHINLLSEDWMNIMFAFLSIIVLFVLIFGSDHFVEGHLWNHIVKKHLATIFLWTFGVLLVLGISLQYLDIEQWISNNIALMIILATLVGIIPESGPHLVFVTLFAAGTIPFPVLLASSISQDGHASIPLLAESRKSFISAKLINCIVALAAGFGAMLLM